MRVGLGRGPDAGGVADGFHHDADEEGQEVVRGSADELDSVQEDEEGEDGGEGGGGGEGGTIVVENGAWIGGG